MTLTKHMHANLMRSSGFEHTFHERYISETLQHLIMRHSMLPLLRVFQHSHLQFIFRVPSDITGDCAPVFIKIAPHKCIVFPTGGLIKELRTQIGLRFRSLGHNKQTGGIFIYSMHQS